MRVVLAYNEPVLPPLHREADSEREILDAVEWMEGHLGHGSFEFIRLPVDADLDSAHERLRQSRPDVVVNLFEGLGDDPHSECRFAQILEDEGVAYTGCSSQALWRAGRKDIAKELFRQAGIATPDFYVVDKLPLEKLPNRWPAFVKPAFRDASIGIDQQSVVMDRFQLEKRIGLLADEYGFPVLVEQYVHGREISIAMIDWPEPLVLPLVETLFVSNSGDWPIVTYDSKWQPDSRDYESTPLNYPADLSPGELQLLTDVSHRAYRVLECRDFVTLDFRLSPDGTPYLLEVNPNPGLKPTSCITDLFDLAGISYGDFLVHLLHNAQTRRWQKISRPANQL